MKFSWRDLNIWHFYSIVFIVFTINRTIQLVDNESVVFKYYNTLLGLKLYHLYCFQYLQCFLELVSLIPLILFTLNKEDNSQNFWKSIWILRIIANTYSHSYDFKIIGMFATENPLSGILAMIQLITMYLPSIIACFIFSFQPNKKSLLISNS